MKKNNKSIPAVCPTEPGSSADRENRLHPSTMLSMTRNETDNSQSGDPEKTENQSYGFGWNLFLFMGIMLFSLLFTACSDFVSPERFTKSHYTLNGILKAGTTISFENPVWIGKSTSLDNLNSAELFVDNATVKILETAVNGDTMSFYLTAMSVPIPESDRVVTFYIDADSHEIMPEYTYRIEVTIPGYEKLIYAETTVPKAAELIPNFNYTPPAGQGYTTDPDDSTTSISYPLVDVHYPVTLKVDGYQSINYMVELYCLEEFSTDLEFTTVFFGQEHPPADMESNYYQASGETIRRINIMSKFISKQHTDGNWYVSLTDYRQAFVFYGRYQVTAYIMDDNYFRYKYMPEGYYHGGVQNALGCFGSASGGVMYTKIVK